MGLRPKATSISIEDYFATWDAMEVYRYFGKVDGIGLTQAKGQMAAQATASLLGSPRKEIMYVNGATVSLHVMLAVFTNL